MEAKEDEIAITTSPPYHLSFSVVKQRKQKNMTIDRSRLEDNQLNSTNSEKIFMKRRKVTMMVHQLSQLNTLKL